MHMSTKLLVTALQVGIASVLIDASARAQTMARVGSPNIALKNGETAELGDLYFVTNCKSVLTSTPDVEILDGPPGIAASVKEEMVLPRALKCPAPVKGGKLFLTAKDIQDQSFSTLTLRVTFKTRDGERKLSQTYNLDLFP